MKIVVVEESRYKDLVSSGSMRLDRKPVWKRKQKCGKVKGHFDPPCEFVAGERCAVRWMDRKVGRPRGRVTVRVLSVAYCSTDGLWDVTFVKAPEEVELAYMAPVSGYTLIASKSIDPDAPVPYELDPREMGRRDKVVMATDAEIDAMAEALKGDLTEEDLAT